MRIKRVTGVFIFELLLILQFNLGYSELITPDTGTVINTDSPESKARELEKQKGYIDYCLLNVGKAFSEIDEGKAGGFWPYKELGVLTYALIADNFQRYGDLGKAGDYYYVNWLHYNSPNTNEPQWPYPSGEFDDYFASAINSWEKAGRYKEIAEHYEDYIVHMYSPRKVGPRDEQIKAMHKAVPHWDKDMRFSYEQDLKKNKKYKRLALNSKPISLEPAVQNHEWFYSDKPEEVLKAFKYYSQNNVRFMLEKALAHKDPVVAAKAKEYLDMLGKQEKRAQNN